MRISFDELDNDTCVILSFDDYKEFRYFIHRIEEFESLSKIIASMKKRIRTSDDEKYVYTYLSTNESEWILSIALDVFVTDTLRHDLIETQNKAIKQREKIIREYEHMVWEQQNIIGVLMQDETIMSDVGQTS